MCAYAFKFKIQCGSALGPGASGLPYYFTPPVTVPDVIGALAVWRHNAKKKIASVSQRYTLPGTWEGGKKREQNTHRDTKQDKTQPKY